MTKRYLPQIKTFEIGIYYRNGEGVNESVNEFVIEVFERTGNMPEIHPCGNHVLVVWQELIEVKQPPIPERTTITSIPTLP